MRKRIIIISANFYPLLGPRPHRSTELAKELSRKGHDVTVYTLKGNYDYRDFEKEHLIIVKDLGNCDGGLLHNDGNINLSIWNRVKIKLFKKLLQYPFINLLSKTYNVLKSENQNYDVLITVAFPHTIHWGAAKYFSKYKKRVKWIADCGDPFMKDPFNNYPNYFNYFEHKWCRLVDFITIPIEAAKIGYYPEYLNKLIVIPQGFDIEDIKIAQYESNSIPVFAYAGVFYPEKRDPSQFLDWLCELDLEFKFIIYTKSISVISPYINKLGNKLEIRDYVPRDQLIFELSKVDFLINILNISSVQQPSKLIDYYLADRPIVDISSNFKEKSIVNEYFRGNYIKSHKYVDIDQFNIKSVVNKFEQLFI